MRRTWPAARGYSITKGVWPSGYPITAHGYCASAPRRPTVGTKFVNTKRIIIMSGKFISFVLAASIAVTSLTAAPAQADGRDVGRLLAALVGIAVVGAVLHDAQQNRRFAAPVHHPKPIYSSKDTLAQYAPQRSLRPKAAGQHIERTASSASLDQDRYSARVPMDAE
jgi:hypothetical protein